MFSLWSMQVGVPEHMNPARNKDVGLWIWMPVVIWITDWILGQPSQSAIPTYMKRPFKSSFDCIMTSGFFKIRDPSCRTQDLINKLQGKPYFNKLQLQIVSY